MFHAKHLSAYVGRGLITRKKNKSIKQIRWRLFLELDVSPETGLLMRDIPGQ